MPTRCIVAGCSNTTKEGVSLHHFPKDEILRKKWTARVKLTRVKWEGPSDCSVICSDHFDDASFDRGMHAMFSINKKRRLKPDAIPVIKAQLSREVMPGTKRRRTAVEKRKKLLVGTDFFMPRSTVMSLTVMTGAVNRARGTEFGNNSIAFCHFMPLKLVFNQMCFNNT
jgi:hypothetical protein